MDDELLVNDRREIDKIILDRLHAFEDKIDSLESVQRDLVNGVLSKFLTELNKFILVFQDQLREHDRRLNNHSEQLVQMEAKRMTADEYSKKHESNIKLWVPITAGTAIATACSLIATWLIHTAGWK